MKIQIPIESFRSDPSRPWWDLPPWGHPLSQGVFPLFIVVAERLIPVGTAFVVGHGISFVISAEHNIREALKHERRLRHLLSAATLPEAIALKEVGISVLHQRWVDDKEAAIHYTLWPLQTVAVAPPSDVVFGSPQFQTVFPTLDIPLSFDVPPRGERVWSIGYTDFKFPEGGIDLEALDAGTFSWRSDYSHRFVVVEGRVERIFAERFASGFVDGPCFTFDAEIFHGQSGGPVLDTTGRVRGVNSASASHFFNRPMSIASFLYPVLFQNLRAGAQVGPTRIEITRPIFKWMSQGCITTDGSVDGDEPTVGFSAPASFAEFIHDDFAGFQSGESATPVTGDHYGMRRHSQTSE
jgi:hypothetical protein